MLFEDSFLCLAYIATPVIGMAIFFFEFKMIFC